MRNAELHAQIDALVEQDRLDEAMRLIDQIEPISLEELREILDKAPLDDEPVSAEQRASLDRAWEVIRGGPPATGRKRSG